MPFLTLQGVYDRTKREFARIRAEEQRQTPDQIDATIAVAAEKEKFTTRLEALVFSYFGWRSPPVGCSAFTAWNMVLDETGKSTWAGRRTVW